MHLLALLLAWPTAAGAQVIVGTNVHVGPGAEGSIAVDPTDPDNLAASANNEHMYSLDGGRHWTHPTLEGFPDPIANPWVDPNVAFASNGDLFRQGLDWLPDGQRGIAIARSGDDGATFPEPYRSWAYEPLVGEGNADQGWMAIDSDPSSPYADRIYVVFSDYPSEGVTPPYPLVGFPLLVVWSSDGGETFGDPVDVSDAPEPLQEASSYVTVGVDGEVWVVWWDIRGRVMIDRSRDGGETWGTDRLVYTFPAPASAYDLSDDVRGNPTVAVDRSDGPFRGSVYVSGIDVNGPSGAAADAWVVHSRDEGESWSAPVFPSDGPRAAYRYYFQPRIVAAPDGRIDAIWYDTRSSESTDTNEVPYDLYFAYSLDGGESFSENVRVTEESSVKRTNCAAQGPCGERVLYEYIGLASERERVYPLWTDLRTGAAAQYTAEIVGFPDRTPPAAVEDLAPIEVAPTTATLGFTAPGDDGREGTATAYDLRIATTEITEATWDDATRVAIGAPRAGGSAETAALADLEPATTYWAALTASDEVPNVSALSNVTTFTTSDEAADAGPDADAGPEPLHRKDDGGCGCRTSRGPGGLGLAISAAMLAVTRRRKRAG